MALDPGRADMAGRKLAAELQSSNIIVALVHPGWVKTDMGGPNAQITPAESAVGILQVMEQLSMDNSGEFWVYNGEKHPW
ncbi:short chain dehydrogenase [Ceratobasidium sp. AG-Ba]|nr:short chain dehydrogenase [Ceratobasidium sp. AG-Ba]